MLKATRQRRRIVWVISYFSEISSSLPRYSIANPVTGFRETSVQAMMNQTCQKAVKFSGLFDEINT